jgi:ketosteroid isomerase-like protein
MGLYIRCCLAIFFLAPLAFQRPANNTVESADMAELTRLETVWNTAYSRGDADGLAPLLADDLIVTMTDMVLMTKAQSLTLLRSGRFKFPRYETSDLRIRAYGDAAVVTGRLQRTREINGQSADDNWRFTKVYVRQAGKWQVVAWHASTNSV